MAKELPYFKFEPNEWQNGNIQMCSSVEKALFIDLCCLYWSRLGDVPLKLAIQKVCGGNATAINSLCKEGVLTIKDDQVSIKFLDDQLQEFSDLSSRNKRNAQIGWDKRRSAKGLSQSNATASVSQSQNDAIREEKIREDKIREKKIKEEIKKEVAIAPLSPKFNFRNSLLDFGFDEQLVSDWMAVRSKKKASNTQTSFNGFINQIKKIGKNPNDILRMAVEGSWVSVKASWSCWAELGSEDLDQEVMRLRLIPMDEYACYQSLVLNYWENKRDGHAWTSEDLGFLDELKILSTRRIHSKDPSFEVTDMAAFIVTKKAIDAMMLDEFWKTKGICYLEKRFNDFLTEAKEVEKQKIKEQLKYN